MTLKIRSRIFQISEATVCASLFRPYWKKYDPSLVCDQLLWALTIQCLSKRFDGESWEPRFTFDGFQLPIQTWLDLENLSVRLEGGQCFVIGHGEAGPAELKLGKRNGSRFQFDCAGKCDVDWDEDFGTDVPFTMSSRIEFEGLRIVGVTGDNDESLRVFLKAHFQLDKLNESPCNVSGTPAKGKKMIEKLFTPA